MDETCYQCNKCGKSFGDSYKLQVHSRKHQPEGKPHKCRVCGKGFATVGHRTQHMEVHHSAPCQYCGTTFTHTRSLVEHEKRCDLKPGGNPAKEFECEDCGTSTNIGLKSLQIIVHLFCTTVYLYGTMMFCFVLQLVGTMP